MKRPERQIDFRCRGMVKKQRVVWRIDSAYRYIGQRDSAESLVGVESGQRDGTLVVDTPCGITSMHNHGGNTGEQQF